ncbi:MAG: substrate-binding domain-containing protein [bacterium]
MGRKTVQGLILAMGLGWCAVPAFSMDIHGTGTPSVADLLKICLKAYAPLSVNVPIQYQARESRQGIDQWLDRDADFLMVNFPLIPTDEKQTGGNVLYIPVGLNAAVVTYNLPGVPSGLRLTPRARFDIFSGKITRWDNSNLREMNPGLPLPDMAIQVLYRDDESSLFDLFPNYLKTIDDSWPMADAGEDRNVHWPVGRGVHGNQELLRQMDNSAGSIGVIDYLAAASQTLPMARLKNEAGFFTAPSSQSLIDAVAELLVLPDDLRVYVTHPRDPDAYPLTSFEWVLVRPRVHRGSHDFRKNQALAGFLGWWLSDGQTVEQEADAVSLPERFLAQAQAQVRAIQVNSNPTPTIPVSNPIAAPATR